jgi:2'-5' RNA ligase
MNEGPPTRRLFFALWPDEVTRARTARAARAVSTPCHGRPVPAANHHITLEFLGDVPPDTFDCLLACAAAFVGEPFELTLDRADSFRRPGIVWLGPSAVPEPLMRLYQHLHTGVARCGLSPEERAFRPHLTIMRKARRGPAGEAFEPIVWPVQDFVLVESVTASNGSRYQVLRRWPLGAAPA